MLAFAAARVTDPENLQVVKGGREFLAAADLELAFLEGRIVKLDHTAAGCADQMVVMRVTADVLIVVMVFAEVNAADPAGLREQLQRAGDPGRRGRGA